MKLYRKLTVDELDEYYENIQGREEILIEYNYDNFINSRYFKDHKKDIVDKYNLLEFYDDIYLIKENTAEECIICMDNTFRRYIKCNKCHKVICNECYELLPYKHKKNCCACTRSYDICEMYYEKN